MPTNKITSKSLLILTWNSNGLTNHRDEILAILQNNRIDIALISETHFTHSSHLNLPGFNIIKTNHPDGTAHAGAAIIIRTSLLFYPLPPYQTDYLQSYGIRTTLNNIPINIHAVYSPPRHTITKTQYENFFDSLGQKFILGGDINAKNTQWGCRANNPRGNTINTLAQLRNYKIHAPPSPTYWPTSRRKNPDILDIFLTKIPNNLHSIVTNLDNLCSDHSSVLLTIDTMPPNKPSKPTLTQGAIDWVTFRSSLENKINLNISLKSPNDIDKAVNFLTKSIQETAWSCSSPPTPKSTTKNLPLYTRSLIAEKRKARATWQRTRFPSDKRVFNNLTNKLKRHLAQIRSENFIKYLIGLSSRDNSLWQTTRKILRSQPTVPPLRKADGTWAINDIEKSNIFRHHLDSTFKPHADILSTTQIHKINHFLLCPLPMSLPPKHIRPSEVKYTIEKSA
uniref:Putative RNA-directed DNA polymerase n=1 Tax=Sipha flava TaxID=143950 RepID=A0A2S2PXP7_9HEMI